MKKEYVSIAIPLGIKRKVFTYRVPKKFRDKAELGMRAIVPFRKKVLSGIIVEISDSKEIENARAIKDLPDETPLFSKNLIEVNKWIADKYFCSLGDVFKAAMPVGSKLKTERVVKLKDKPDKTKPFFQEIIDTIEKRNGSIPISDLEKELEQGSLSKYLDKLDAGGVIEYDYRITRNVKPKYVKYVCLPPREEKSLEDIKEDWENLSDRAYKQKELLKFLIENPDMPHKLSRIRKKYGYGVAKRLRDKGLVKFLEKEIYRGLDSGWLLKQEEQESFELTDHQKSALEEISDGIDDNSHHTFLLHGVTGSGKTEVYMRATSHALNRGKGVIILVPEISLVPQLWGRFRRRFGDQIGILHSKLSAGERFDSWRQIKNGDLPIVIGARSAIFAPVQNLGLLILDEEFSSNYKQEEPPPYYDAREVAKKRSELADASVVLGTATPSIESYYNAMRGEYKLSRLPTRVPGSLLPEVDIVDLKKEREKRNNYGSFSNRLIEEIGKRLESDEKVILLLNRRGYASYIQCPDCGHIEQCKNCNVSLTYHWTDQKLKCHYCGYEKEPSDICPNCQAPQVNFKGRGTQRIEDELKQWYDKDKIFRLDTDTTSRKKGLSKILNKFNDSPKSVLIGTQMIAKGLDFPEVTLVGVLNADIGLSLPDFRASERIFQLLMQVEGRAGRGMKPGKVLIQTYHPEDYSIRCAIEHDYINFYNNEIIERRELNYPPFSNLILVRGESKDRDTLAAQLTNFKNELSINFTHDQEVEILGPAPAPLEKIKNKWRWNILIKTSSNEAEVLETLEGLLRKAWQGVRITVNVDPKTIL